jgi:predicted site-specific integrase-resolvase
MKDAIEYLPSKEIRDKFHISYTTLKRWAEQGKVSCILTPGGNRRYKATDIARMFPEAETQIINKTGYCYARVSSDGQKDDLTRQIEYLKQQKPNFVIIKDIGSGVNFNRPGFKRLLELVNSGKVSEIAIAHKDRLCRFGYEIVEWIAEKAGVKIVVLSQGEDHIPNPQQELSKDLLTITNHFVARNNGMRSAENRRRKRKLEANEEEEHLQNESSGRKNIRKKSKSIKSTTKETNKIIEDEGSQGEN